MRDLISKLLVRDPWKRYTAEQAYEHPWIQEEVSKITSDDVINEEVLSSIQTFVESQNFKKATLTFIASRIPEECIENLRDAFIKIDWNGDGMLTEEELELGFKYMEGISIERDEISWIMQAMDTNKNGSLDYTEFIAGCMNSYVYTKGNNL